MILIKYENITKIILIFYIAKKHLYMYIDYTVHIILFKKYLKSCIEKLWRTSVMHFLNLV
jgi:hypothetical protein